MTIVAWKAIRKIQVYLLHFHQVSGFRFCLPFSAPFCLLSSRIVTFMTKKKKKKKGEKVTASAEQPSKCETLIIVDFVRECNRKILCKFLSGWLNIKNNQPFSPLSSFSVSSERNHFHFQYGIVCHSCPITRWRRIVIIHRAKKKRSKLHPAKVGWVHDTARHGTDISRTRN